MKKTKQTFEDYVKNLSWNKPIEQEILSFLDLMISQWEMVASNGNIDSDSPKYVVMAYKTVKEHIEEQIMIRNGVKK